VNFLYDNIAHVLQNTIDSSINSATDRRGGYVLERMFTKFVETTQHNGHYAVSGLFKVVLQNTIDSCINSATDRRGYVLERMCLFTKFSEITQCNGHYVVQGHSRSPILVPIESSTTSY